MIRILLAGAVLIGLAGCAKPWATGQNEIVMLPDVDVLPGKHCESSAMLNMLHYLGYPVNEEMIAGGGGAMAFVYLKNGFPFLGGRNYTMRENFFKNTGVIWRSARNEDPKGSWSGVMNVLKQGIPVVLRVDMRYLPYRYGGKYGPSYVSFGWHLIALFGIDMKKGCAYVSDTEYAGLQEIKLADLDKARSSGTKVFPPMREYYWAEKMPADFRIDWKKLTMSAIDNVIANLEQTAISSEPKTETGLAGLKNLGKNILNIEKDVPGPFLLPAVFGTFHGYIAEFGTDGAAFRIFFRDFLLQAAVKLNDRKLSKLTAAIDVSIRYWKLLADEFQSISLKIKDVKNKEQRTELYKKASGLAEELYAKELAYYQALKKYRESKN